MGSSTTANNLSGHSDHRLLRVLLIAAGLLVLGLVAWRVTADYRTYFSPLDEVDVSQGQAEGFIPLYEAEGGQNPGGAPTLAAVAPVVGREPEQTSQAPATPTVLGEDEGALELQFNRGTPQATRPAAILPYATPAFDQPQRLIPDRIVIPSIGLDAPVKAVHMQEVEAHDGNTYLQWTAPYEFAAGWHDTSAALGEFGNLVLNGHHNLAGEVFREIHTLEDGAQIFVYSGEQAFVYKVGLNLLLKERFQPVEVRLQNAQWILPSQDTRLTLITCWPYESNTHRVVIVALPSETREIP